MKGFLTDSDAFDKPPQSLVPKCGSCGLLKTCITPKMPVDGDGKKGILLVGEAPGRNEDRKGVPFVGESGDFLDVILTKLGINMRRDCWLTNALICRPPNNKIDDDNKIGYCRPNLLNSIKKLRPKVVVLMGAPAVKSVIGDIWREDPGGIYRWAGWEIPDQKYNAWVCPTYHPAHILKSDKEKDVLTLHFVQHMKNAVSHVDKPYITSIPNYPSQVECITDTAEAARIIRKMVKRGGLAAFDFENSPLKPEGEGAYIRCCSICWEGRKTIVFPWEGEVLGAMREFLKSDVGKIASNMKHEDRWARRLLCGVRNWRFDTMLASHILDNRKQISGIKFQAYVLLGQPAWDSKVKKYLHADTSMTHNEVHKVGLMDLMQYCGIDSLMEYHVAKIQAKKLNVNL